MWIDYAGLTPNELRGIKPPLLLVVGDRDEAVRLEHVVSLYRTLPTAELAVIPHADHGGPISPQRARLMADVIRDFAARRHD
jgi:pimeloyl-ACP methyl ester carboxylesterase